MSTDQLLQMFLVYGPVVMMVLIGFVVSARSGVISWTTGSGFRQVLGNISQLLVTLALCLAFLVVVQQVVGFHTALMW